MARKYLMAGNWKMNKTIGEAVVLAQDISNQYEDSWLKNCDVVVCPPFVDLKPVKTVFEFDRIEIGVGAQNVHWAESGAYTGEISVPMLKEIGCGWCIIGHSERREMFGETNEGVNKKAKALLAAKINPIICVGESLAIRDEGTTLDFVCAQVKAAFAGIEPSEAKDCVIAYEPIWAIGTGRTATPEQAEEMCAFIRKTLIDMYDEETADEIIIQYGGSVKPANASEIMNQDEIDGALVGGASLKAADFMQIIDF